MTKYWGGHVLLDPADLGRMFSTGDSWANLPSVYDEVQEESLVKLEEVKSYFDFIPAREADYLELYFFKRLRQTAIAELFNVSQPTVCYRLQRGAARLRYLIDLPEVKEDVMREDLRKVISDETDVSIMLGMVRTTCQSDVARSLGVTQGFVRHRFLRTVDRLERMVGMGVYVEVFKMVATNLNILKDTCRSSWSDDLIHSLC